MDTYRKIIFNKDDKKIIDSIKRKLRDYPHKGYKKDCFKYFTNGIIYYNGRKIIGFILLEFHIDKPSKSVNRVYEPNYIDILIKFYNSDEIMDVLFKSIHILFEQHQFTYIKGWPMNYNEYLIFKKNNFYIYNHYAIASKEVLSMRKMLDDDKNNYWLSKDYTLNLEECPENSICRQIVENGIL
jgi:hypothetical protein